MNTATTIPFNRDPKTKPPPIKTRMLDGDWHMAYTGAYDYPQNTRKSLSKYLAVLECAKASGYDMRKADALIAAMVADDPTPVIEHIHMDSLPMADDLDDYSDITIHE